MDALTLRRKNRLELLIASKPYNGDRTAFIRRSGLTKGRISQLLDPDQPFGERAGMRLAAALNLDDERWFEREAAPPVSTIYVWPFKQLRADQIQNLDATTLAIVENYALWVLSTASGSRNKSDTGAQNETASDKNEFTKGAKFQIFQEDVTDGQGAKAGDKGDQQNDAGTNLPPAQGAKR